MKHDKHDKITKINKTGCCLSPTLFNIFIEPLAQDVRQNKDVIGISIGEEEHKIGLFADDVIFFIKQPDITLPHLMTLLQLYGKLAGSKINISKRRYLHLTINPRQKF